MFLENIPHNNQTGISEILTSERCCDLCSRKQDVIDMAPCPDGNGYYCEDCIKNGDAESYLKRKMGFTKTRITKFLNSIML